jgi:RNA polymerase sigma-70 factor (ECF subfamily)
MTAWTTSITLPVSGQDSCPAGEKLHVQPARSSADAEARRLAAGVARGEEAAFRELYDRYQERLFRFAVVLGQGDETLGGEIVQSAFVTAAAKLRGVESEAHLWNWLARVARQHLAKTRRHRRHDPTVTTLADLPDYADPHQPESLLEEKLDAALVAMEPEERQLIESFYFDGLSHKEIADQMGATPKAVSSRLERARARLRWLLNRTLSHET